MKVVSNILGSTGVFISHQEYSSTFLSESQILYLTACDSECVRHAAERDGVIMSFPSLRCCGIL